MAFATASDLLHVERVRTRIASDLHDDIGAGLSHVAVLAEVLRKEWGRDGNKARLHLDQIARISSLVLEITDDGCGFIAGNETAGHGLLSMRRRASHIGAKLDVETAPDRGTIIRLTAPLHRPIWQRRAPGHGAN